MAWWRILAEYFTPDALRGDWESIRQLRLMLGLTLAGLGLGGMYAVFYWFIGHYWGVATILVCILLQLCVPFLLRSTGRLRIGGHLSLFVWCFGFSFLAAIEGGIHGFSIAWLSCGGPLLALLLLKRFEALFWCAFCIFSTVVFSLLELFRIKLPLSYPEHWEPIVLVASIAGLVVFMVLLGVLFEDSRNEALASMEGALTERERTERARLATEESNRSKDQFLTLLSHELRTPLTPVLAAASDREMQEGVPLHTRKAMAMIRRNVELEAKLVDDLLDVTQISSGKLVLNLEPVNAHSCLKSALEICRADANAKEIQTVVRLQAKDYYISADPVRLRQVFWNLLRNAIKFTPQLGQITVATSNTGGKLQIQISDTGVGIEPDFLPKIFNAFEQGEQATTRQFGGLGLGLSIAKTVVDMHHGQLTAFSKGKNQGSMFSVELDTVQAPVEKWTGPEVPKSQNRNLPKILLVEDDHETRRVLCRLLRRQGYEVESADGVRKGLEISEKEVFDLVISDLGLPDGTGWDLMRQIKTLQPIPGIALSGYGTDDDLRRSREAGFAEHIVKPVNFAVLKTSIQRLTGT